MRKFVFFFISADQDIALVAVSFFRSGTWIYPHQSPLSIYDWPISYLYPPIAVQYPLGPVCDWPEVIDCTMGTTPSPTTAPPCNCEPWQDCNQARISEYILPLFESKFFTLDIKCQISRHFFNCKENSRKS
jgi:hypothetical protein